jgi:hypothetical protein
MGYINASNGKVAGDLKNIFDGAPRLTLAGGWIPGNSYTSPSSAYPGVVTYTRQNWARCLHQNHQCATAFWQQAAPAATYPAGFGCPMMTKRMNTEPVQTPKANTHHIPSRCPQLLRWLLALPFARRA